MKKNTYRLEKLLEDLKHYPIDQRSNLIKEHVRQSQGFRLITVLFLIFLGYIFGLMFNTRFTNSDVIGLVWGYTIVGVLFGVIFGAFMKKHIMPGGD